MGIRGEEPSLPLRASTVAYLDSHRWLAVSGEALVDELEEERTLADARLADDNHLEEVVVRDCLVFERLERRVGG